MIQTFKTVLWVTFSILIGNEAFGQTVNSEDYVLELKKVQIEIRNENTFWIVPVVLTNNSKDTLKYYSMSCSWQEFYSVSSEKLIIQLSECGKNAPIIVEIPPKESKTIQLDLLLLSPTIDTSEIKFKIGLNLMKVSESQNRFDYDHEEQNLRKNIIWSNYIIMKTENPDLK
ncbi:MAG: hypothetical protein COA58_03000 [Bacteroidetes bacterium]|nr:MAG: hypothetical protein COA58_03000 [Bacteroidota bacterium]